MSDSAQAKTSPHRLWAVPSDPKDLEPLPVLVADVEGLPDGDVFLFDRKKQEFDTSAPRDPRHTTLYHTFEECRSAMMTQWLDDLRDATFNARHAAGVIEHLRTTPTRSFPDVLPEVSEPQASQKEEAQEKVETAKVTVRPSIAKGKSNA